MPSLDRTLLPLAPLRSWRGGERLCAGAPPGAAGSTEPSPWPSSLRKRTRTIQQVQVPTILGCLSGAIAAPPSWHVHQSGDPDGTGASAGSCAANLKQRTSLVGAAAGLAAGLLGGPHRHALLKGDVAGAVPVARAHGHVLLAAAGTTCGFYVTDGSNMPEAGDDRARTCTCTSVPSGQPVVHPRW